MSATVLQMVLEIHTYRNSPHEAMHKLAEELYEKLVQVVGVEEAYLMCRED